MDKTLKHPSGRPIAKKETKGRPIWRIPEEGPVTPRLREKKHKTEAIGFVVTTNDECE